MDDIKIGTQWKTRGGWRAVVVTESKNGKNLCTWQDNCRDGGIFYHNGVGRHLSGSPPNSDNDLIEPWKELVERKGWINIWEGCGRDSTIIYPTRKKARKGNASPSVIACIEIEFTEGEGL